MKLVTLLLSLLFCVTTLPQGKVANGEKFNCVVTQVSKMYTIVCDSPNLGLCAPSSTDPACVHTILDIPKENWNEFPEWHYRDTEYTHPPDELAEPYLGQVLKGQWLDGHFQAVENCGVRTYRNIERWRGGRYSIPPINSLTPEDCRRPTSAFVMQLIREAQARQE